VETVITMTLPATMTTSLHVLLAMLGLSLLVIVHEAGHYLAARAAGMRVTRFSIGFGPVIVSYRPHNSPTTFALGAIPFFAYVMIAGMSPAEEGDANDPSLYANKGVWARIFAIAGGPFANYVAACALVFAVAVGLGWPASHSGSATELSYQRLDAASAAELAVVYPWRLTVANLEGMADMVARRTTEGLTGPVGMSKLIAEQAEQGAFAFAHVLIALSVAMGLFNLLPFPFLDGGRLIFLGCELVTRRRVKPQLEAVVHAVGMLLLLGVISLVTVRDLIG
jgi:membrane-associated protease RseP (regulator of RpoE activity)